MTDDALRERAQRMLDLASGDVSNLAAKDIHVLIHELRVHQIELEMQNEELEAQQQELIDSRDRYAELYELAPVGYVTLAADDSIQQMNQVAAEILGTDPAEAVGACWTGFLNQEDSDGWYLYRQAINADGVSAARAIEVRLPEERTVLLHSHAMRDDSRAIESLLVSITDITDQKAAEQQQQRTADTLRESEQRFRALIENSFDAITMFDQTGTPFYISPSVRRVLGYEPDELIGRQGPHIVHPDDVEEAGKFFARALEQPGQPMQMTHRVRHKDGSYRIIEVTGINLLDVLGVEAMVSNFHDVTNHHEAEQALAETERRLHHLAENVEEVFWVVAADFSELFYVSPAYERIWGHSVDSLYNEPRSFLNAIHDEDKPQLMAAIGRRSTDAATESTAVEYRIVRPDGEVRWIRSRQSSVVGDDGTVARMVGVAEDVTERKQAEQQRHRVESRIRAILNSALDGIITMDHQGRIVELNPAAEQMFGRAPGSAVGRLLAEIAIPPRLREAHQRALAKYLDDGESTILGRRVELTASHADGHEFPIELTVTRIDTDGPPMFTGHVRDITERRQAELALRESERLNRRLVESSRDIIWETRLDGLPELWDDVKSGRISIDELCDRQQPLFQFHRTFVSPAVTDILGWTPDEAMHLPMHQAHTADSLAKLSAALRDSLERHLDRPGEAYPSIPFESHEFHKDGHIVPLDITYRLLVDEQHRPFGFMGLKRDITERRQAERKVAESEQRNRQALQAARAGAWEWVIATGETVWSDENYQLMGLEPGSVPSNYDNWFARVHPEDRPLADRVVRQAVESREALDFEYRCVWPDGTVRWLHDVGAILLDEAGEPIGMYGIQIDVTERKRAEQDLSIRDEAIARSVMPAAFGDANHVITHANQAFLDLFGFESQEQVVGMPNTRFESHPTSITEINAAMLQQGSWTGEIVSRKLDGTPIYLLLSASMIHDEAGDPVCSLVTLVDITERNQIRQQHEQLLSELVQKNAELERFTYTVSHDLKSPLVTIAGFLAMLQKDLKDQNQEAIDDDMSEISGAVTRMKQLLDQLLDLARIGHVMNPAEDVALADLLNEVLGSLSVALTERNVTIDVGELPTIHCDRMRMREVLQNLVENAIKFSDRENRIEIGVRNRDNETLVFVKDNGIGIAPEFSARVFGLFEQLNAAGEGTGIGLAIAKRIIETHGGRIWVESEGEGQGSVFCFTVKAL